MDKPLKILRPPNCGHDPSQLTLARFFRHGYTEDHEHLLICKICEREAMDEFYRKEPVNE
jgi:hypothetical protein